MKEILFSQKLDLIEHKQTVYTMTQPTLDDSASET